MNKTIPAQLQNNLNKVNYPASKKDLLIYAEEKGVDEQILRILKRLPVQQYETLADVSRVISEMSTVQVNLEQLWQNLYKVNYPVSKKDLLIYAEEKGVDEQILRALKHLPAKQYETFADVSQAIGNSE